MNIIIPPEHIGHFTIYQVDLNDIRIGPFIITRHKLPELLFKVRRHAWTLVKTIYRTPYHHSCNLDFQLVLKIIDMNQRSLQEPTVVSLGNYNQWEKNLFHWFDVNIDGCNLYVDSFYILSYEKSAV